MVVVKKCSAIRIMVSGMFRFWNCFTCYDRRAFRIAYLASPTFPWSRFNALCTPVFSVIATTREQAIRVYHTSLHVCATPSLTAVLTPVASSALLVYVRAHLIGLAVGWFGEYLFHAHRTAVGTWCAMLPVYSFQALRVLEQIVNTHTVFLITTLDSPAGFCFVTEPVCTNQV